MVAGETGSGKTTQLPKICLELGRRSIGHTQPRRIAARTVAERVAEELHSAIGDLVGYQVRFTRRAGRDTRLKIMTDGVLLAEISHDRARAGAVIVGFAAETGDATGSVLELGRAKLARKGCDLLVVNDVSGGAVFGSADNEAVVLAADGAVVEVPHGSKTALAHVIWDEVSRRFAR